MPVINRISLFLAYDNDFPRDVLDCDAWLVSGPLLNWELSEAANRYRLERVIERAAEATLPIFGLWHGEHVLHEALAKPGSAAPGTAQFPSAIRNPIETFGMRDLLYRWCDERLRVVDMSCEESQRTTIVSSDNGTNKKRLLGTVMDAFKAAA